MATAILLPPSATPSDYHRIISPTLTVPRDESISIPVGLLACQRDPLLKTLNTVVVSVSVAQPPPVEPGKKSKKAVLAPDLPKEPLLHVLLHDTVLFPEGGGQPTDIGLIITEADGMTWQVVQVKRHGGHAVHYVKLHGGNVDKALLAFTPGSKVTVQLGQEGYDKRYDHMSMHTSQHLLSALIETRLNLPTLSWSLTSYPSPCYIEVPRGMTQEEISSIQAEANRLVFEGRKVHVEVTELEEEDKSITAPKLESGRSVGKALPEDYSGGVKRVIIIDGVDRNPCCGTHLPSIHNLQLFLLPHTEALSRSSTTSARLYFLCGPRLITYLTSAHNTLTSTSVILSCGTSLVPERVGQVVEERKKAEKRLGDVELELADHIGMDLIDCIAGSPSKESFKHHMHRLDDSVNPLGFLSSVAHAFTNQWEEQKEKGSYLTVLSSSPTTQTATSTSTVLVFGSDDARVKATGDALKSQLAVKGGGKGNRWSGKFTGVWRDHKETLVVDRLLESD